MFLLENTIRDYAWGSPDAIQHLLGRPVTGEPAAELWMGAHPGAPSRVFGGSEDGANLDTLIAEDAADLLGPAVVSAFGARLPYLFKVLAAAKPLSLQAHPSPEQAKAGFRAEQAEGALAADDPNRNYRDDQAKPELIAALTRFEALCGFAEPTVVATRLDALLAAGAPAGLRDLRATLLDGPPVQAIAAALVSLLRPDEPDDIRDLVDATVVTARALADADADGTDPSIALLPRLARDYPGDPGVLVSLLCNFVVLEPGQALYLPAGNLHAYCSGLGMELMNASDNVLRGGLTPKHIDVDELLHVLDTTPRPATPVEPTQVEPGWVSYDTDAPSFELGRIDGPVTLPAAPQILFCASGSAHVTATGTGESRALGAGQSVFVPDVDGPVAVAEVAPGTSIFRAAPPRRLTAVPRTASSSSDTSDTEATA
ncbi:MAG TPA: mannose-6-phosphate isomerase, class I [Actinopolymorphaceae bacterium]|jgi:mannose-6-phosphate isomerase